MQKYRSWEHVPDEMKRPWSRPVDRDEVETTWRLLNTPPRRRKRVTAEELRDQAYMEIRTAMARARASKTTPRSRAR